MDVALVGLGPWGLAVLERLVALSAHDRTPAQIFVIEPGRPGAGFFGEEERADYLLLNTPCGQHVIHPDGEGQKEPIYAESLYSWARREGYKWVGRRCLISDSGTDITPDDFLPRRLMGEWLYATYQAICAWAPDWVSVDHLALHAVDVQRAAGGQEMVRLADGRRLVVDHVVISTGHTPDTGAGHSLSSALEPYPISQMRKRIRPGQSVAVAGLGLVAVDVVTALTLGRGGRFESGPEGLSYRPSGREPSISVFSRSGIPYLAKAIGASDPTGEYVPVICTPAASAHLRHQGSRRLDFRKEVLPMLTAEMQVRFYRQAALLSGRGIDEATRITQLLAEAWLTGTFDNATAGLSEVYGACDFERQLVGNPLQGHYRSSHDYQRAVAKAIEADLIAAQPVAGLVTPVKAGYETLRILRDWLRDLVEFRGLTLESYLDFNGSIAARVRSAVAGPPAARLAEFLALIDAGVVHVPFGPDPSVEPDPLGGFRIGSTSLAEPHARRVDHLVCGYLNDPTISRSRSPLIRRLAKRGRLVPLHYGEAMVGSVDLTPESHPIAADGTVQESMWVFGALTEGVRYFTQYVPSPRSRVRAFVDAEWCARSILDATVSSDLSTQAS